MSSKPIGIFDSGVGGTSIFHEIHSLLPFENTVYLADSKHAPYGEKSKEEIIDLSIKNVEFLINNNAKLIVVACNTATTNSIDVLRQTFDLPFIGIEPAIKPAALNTKTNAIGILATKGTLSSSLFHKTSNLYGGDIDVIERVGDGIVELMEEGKMESSEMRDLLVSYITPMIDKHIDHLVLGCTHYPYLIPQLKEILPDHVKIIDSGQAVAKQTKNILINNGLVNTKRSKPRNIFYGNSDLSVLRQFIPAQFQVVYKDV